MDERQEAIRKELGYDKRHRSDVLGCCGPCYEPSVAPERNVEAQKRRVRYCCLADLCPCQLSCCYSYAPTRNFILYRLFTTMIVISWVQCVSILLYAFDQGDDLTQLKTTSVAYTMVEFLLTIQMLGSSHYAFNYVRMVIHTPIYLLLSAHILLVGGATRAVGTSVYRFLFVADVITDTPTTTAHVSSFVQWLTIVFLSGSVLSLLIVLAIVWNLIRAYGSREMQATFLSHEAVHGLRQDNINQIACQLRNTPLLYTDAVCGRPPRSAAASSTSRFHDDVEDTTPVEVSVSKTMSDIELHDIQQEGKRYQREWLAQSHRVLPHFRRGVPPESKENNDAKEETTTSV